jgi:hypothetical protein
MKSNHTSPTVLIVPPVPRCEGCGGRLECCEGEWYCADCTRFDVRPLYVARVPTGEFVNESGDLGALTRWCAELLDGSPGDVVVADGAGRVLCVVLDTGLLV